MTLNEYMELPYRMEIVPDKEEEGYAVTSLELSGCVTCGATLLESLVSNAENTKKKWLIAAIEDGQEIPGPDGLNEYSGQFKLWIPKSWHCQLSEQSKRVGIGMNQYCLYLYIKE